MVPIPHFLNFHRQCAFSDERVDEKGKITKVYETYLTPVEKLLSIQNAGEFLKSDVTQESLRAEMMRQTHLVASQEMQEAKAALFKEINRRVVQ